MNTTFPPRRKIFLRRHYLFGLPPRFLLATGLALIILPFFS
ncbi:unnamed protein product [Acidocella sp. C78]|nr:hypothetical protein [Acidocella sp. C78]CAG4907438.1 unnamed protein product [Acidocella sp. C78]